jgi:hypothetical protein
MTELEWLKQQSGLTDDELNAYEAILGDVKFKQMLQKVIEANQALEQAKTKAEQDFERLSMQYQSEYLPALRDATQQAVEAEAKRAAAEAKLSKFKDFGFNFDDPQQDKQPPRAPGSPDPNPASTSNLTKEDLSRLSDQQAAMVLALQDLNAEHFSLFGSPLGNTQELVAEVNRQRMMGNKGFTLKHAWEQKFNVAAKRAEIAAEAQKKHDEEIRAAAIKEERERMSANPHVRRGQPSKFDRYKISESSQTKPWQSSRSARERNTDWRNMALAKVREAQVA